MFFCGKIDNLSSMKKHLAFEKEEYSLKGGDVFFFLFLELMIKLAAICLASPQPFFCKTDCL